MCGIVYGFRKDNHPISKNILKRFDKQRSRGTQGFGYLLVSDGKVEEIIRSKTEEQIKDAIKNEKASEILFHHRMPTSTANYRETTHPIVVKNDLLDYDYYVVHNGVLRNEDELKDKFEEMGFEYTTLIEKVEAVRHKGKVVEEIVQEKYNDSESLAIDLALYLDNKKRSIESDGTIAFVCLQTDKEGNIVNIHFGHNEGNPLILEMNNDLMFLKSSGHGRPLTPNVLYTLNYKTKELTENDVSIGYYASRIGYDNNKYTDCGTTRSIPMPTQTQKSYTDDQNRSYFVSEQRWFDLSQEEEDLTIEIEVLESEMSKAVANGNVSLYEELEIQIDELKLKRNNIQQEIDWLDDYLASDLDDNITW